MRRILFTLAVAGLAAVASTSLNAQRPEGDGPREGDRPREEGRGEREDGRGRFGGGPGAPGGRFQFQLPVMKALDADGDGDISEKELENAVVALKSLDKNKDGKVSADELRPDFGGPGRGARGDAGGSDPGGRGPARGDARPGDGRRPGGEDGAGGREGRRPEGDGARPGPGREGFNNPGAGGFRGGFRPPSPEDFVDRALEFDADKDGKLSKDELAKMAEQFTRGPGGGFGRPGAGDGEPRRPQRPE